MPTYGGWTGKTLRVDLTARTSTVENTLEKYKDFWGGTGMAYKVLWDEVPVGTDPFDAKNRLIFGWGPLTGTGAPCGGRTGQRTPAEDQAVLGVKRVGAYRDFVPQHLVRCLLYTSPSP